MLWRLIFFFILFAGFKSIDLHAKVSLGIIETQIMGLNGIEFRRRSDKCEPTLPSECYICRARECRIRRATLVFDLASN